MRVLVTGVDGLLGTHVRALLHSKNAAALFNSEACPYEIITMNRVQFSDESISSRLVVNVEVVIHCAGVNRGSDDEVGKGNQQIAEILVARLTSASATPHVVYLNSTHSSLDSIYGIGKKETSVIFTKWAEKNSAQYTDLVLPHIFGEGGKPFYNTVTATLCKQIIDGEKPVINPQGKVELLHASDAAEIALECGLASQGGSRRAAGQDISIPALYDQLCGLYHGYINGVMPALISKLEVQLFNTLRAYLFPGFYPKELITHSDNRGLLFEAVKGGSGQTFLSWTKPGITRGDHFHLHKVERFLVVSGSATIRLRHIFSSQIHEYRVNGDIPSYVDIPTMYTHSIENTGDEALLTMFWAHEIFDPKSPDTYADKVLDS